MDLWVVAAAAGAGYIAKHLQNLPSSEKQRLVESSSKFTTHSSLESRNFLQQIRDRNCPLRRLARERELRDASSGQKDRLDGRILDMEQLVSTGSDSHSGPIMTSPTRGSDDVEDYNVIWLSSLPPGFSGRESILNHMEFVDADCSPFEHGKFKLLKSRTSGYFVKTLSSLRSGLSPQLCKEHEKVEEYVYSSVPLPCISTMRPLLITEGTHIISRSNSIPMGIWPNGSKDTIKTDAYRNEENASSSDPSLDNTTSVELRGWTSGCNKRAFGKASPSPGSPNFVLLLMMEIIIGILSTIIANESEVTSLNEQLKLANSLVQDLQEELEMKDKLTVKHLADEDSQPLSIKNPHFFNQELILSAPKPQPDKPEDSEIDAYGIKIANARTAEDSLLRNEIEAELEAELERLELNLKTSVTDRPSGFTQIDLEREADTIQEDMKLNLLRRRYDDDSSEADYDEENGTDREQILPPNFAVSPRELTIRLHKLMESRLEERIKDLETALQNSQNRLRSLESEFLISQDITSTPESPASFYK